MNWTHKQVVEAWSAFEKYLVEKRYAVRGEDGVPLEHSYKEVIERVANWVTSDKVLSNLPKEITKYVRMNTQSLSASLLAKVIVPATPVLMNGGSKTRRPGYFSCFPLGYVDDSGSYDHTGVRISISRDPGLLLGSADKEDV